MEQLPEKSIGQEQLPAKTITGPLGEFPQGEAQAREPLPEFEQQQGPIHEAEIEELADAIMGEIPTGEQAPHQIKGDYEAKPKPTTKQTQQPKATLKTVPAPSLEMPQIPKPDERGTVELEDDKGIWFTDVTVDIHGNPTSDPYRIDHVEPLLRLELAEGQQQGVVQAYVDTITNQWNFAQQQKTAEEQEGKKESQYQWGEPEQPELRNYHGELVNQYGTYCQRRKTNSRGRISTR